MQPDKNLKKLVQNTPAYLSYPSNLVDKSQLVRFMRSTNVRTFFFFCHVKKDPKRVEVYIEKSNRRNQMQSSQQIINVRENEEKVSFY